MTPLEWNTATHALGVEAMDSTHHQFIELLNYAQNASASEFPSAFEKLLMHTEQHFANEKSMMESSAFPATDEHVGEHNRILGEMKQFQKRVNKGLQSFGRAYLRDTIPQWFSLHLITMDSALASHLKAQAAATTPDNI